MDKRHFTVVEKNGKEHGLYVSSTPSSAAKKAVSKLCASNKSKKVEFYVREITQGSKKKTYGAYLGEMKKLKVPIELKGRVIKYEPVAKLSKKSISKKGGMNRLGNEGSSAVENNSEELPKITEELTVEQFNTIVCAMIDYLIKENILEYEPDYEPDKNNEVGKGYTKWGESNSSRLHYFRINFDKFKEIIKKHLKIDGETLWGFQDVYFDKIRLFDEINKIIDKIEIIPHKRGHTNRKEMTDERSKIKTLISTIVTVIKKIMEHNNEPCETNDQFDNFRQFKKFNFHIEKMLLERYYDDLSNN